MSLNRVDRLRLLASNSEIQHNVGSLVQQAWARGIQQVITIHRLHYKMDPLMLVIIMSESLLQLVYIKGPSCSLSLPKERNISFVALATFQS